MKRRDRSEFWYWLYQGFGVVALVLCIITIFTDGLGSVSSMVYLLFALVFGIEARLERSPY